MNQKFFWQHMFQKEGIMIRIMQQKKGLSKGVITYIIIENEERKNEIHFNNGEKYVLEEHDGENQQILEGQTHVPLYQRIQTIHAVEEQQEQTSDDMELLFTVFDDNQKLCYLGTLTEDDIVKQDKKGDIDSVINQIKKYGNNFLTENEYLTLKQIDENYQISMKIEEEVKQKTTNKTKQVFIKLTVKLQKLQQENQEPEKFIKQEINSYKETQILDQTQRQINNLKTKLSNQFQDQINNLDKKFQEKIQQVQKDLSYLIQNSNQQQEQQFQKLSSQVDKIDGRLFKPQSQQRIQSQQQQQTKPFILNKSSFTFEEDIIKLKEDLQKTKDEDINQQANQIKQIKKILEENEKQIIKHKEDLEKTRNEDIKNQARQIEHFKKTLEENEKKIIKLKEDLEKTKDEDIKNQASQIEQFKKTQEENKRQICDILSNEIPNLRKEFQCKLDKNYNNMLESNKAFNEMNKQEIKTLSEKQQDAKEVKDIIDQQQTEIDLIKENVMLIQQRRNQFPIANPNKEKQLNDPNEQIESEMELKIIFSQLQDRFYKLESEIKFLQENNQTVNETLQKLEPQILLQHSMAQQKENIKKQDYEEIQQENNEFKPAKSQFPQQQNQILGIDQLPIEFQQTEGKIDKINQRIDEQQQKIQDFINSNYQEINQIKQMNNHYCDKINKWIQGDLQNQLNYQISQINQSSQQIQNYSEKITALEDEIGNLKKKLKADRQKIDDDIVEQKMKISSLEGTFDSLIDSKIKITKQFFENKMQSYYTKTTNEYEDELNKLQQQIYSQQTNIQKNLIEQLNEIVNLNYLKQLNDTYIEKKIEGKLKSLEDALKEQINEQKNQIVEQINQQQIIKNNLNNEITKLRNETTRILEQTQMENQQPQNVGVKEENQSKQFQLSDFHYVEKNIYMTLTENQQQTQFEFIIDDEEAQFEIGILEDGNLEFLNQKTRAYRIQFPSGTLIRGSEKPIPFLPRQILINDKVSLKVNREKSFFTVSLNGTDIPPIKLKNDYDHSFIMISDKIPQETVEQEQHLIQNTM